MNFRKLIPNDLVNILKHYPTGFLANLYYRFPSHNLKIIGVTGTDGKTTTATMLYQVLKDSGKKVALISTVSAKIGEKEMDTGFHVTSPNHFPLQKFLRQIADQKIEYVVLETTSHGFAQYRFWGIKFFAGIVTNITEDHLDYHKTWSEYLKAKAKLFSQTQFSVLNIEDKSYPFLKKTASGKIITYGIKKGDFNLKNFPLRLSILGNYNYYNALAVVALSSHLGLSPSQIKNTLNKFCTVSGRMQIMHQKPLILVDFAHTPNALLNALISIRTENKKIGRLISVFGCAGERDRLRRKMGLVSAQNADITIITAEDPRIEGVEKISDEIASWAEKGGAKFTSTPINNISDWQSKLKKFPIYLRIPDREKAINFAINIANKNDIVGIFGKGHEKSMCYGKTEKPWSDQKTVKKVLKAIK